MPQPGPNVSRDQLEDAFQVFNQVSNQLVDSYQILQSQVTRLSEELSASRSARMLELAEKTRLAKRITRLLETLPAAVIVLDGEQLVQQFNPAAQELLPSIALGQAWLHLLDEEGLAGQQGDERWTRHGRLVSVTSRSLNGEPGSIYLLLDVTETRELQTRVEQQQRLTMMGEMAAQLAHQIRTPLSSAMLYTAHLSKSDLTVQQRERFSKRCADRLRHIERQVNDMLSFARGGQFETELLSVNALQKELQQMSAHLFRESSAELILESLYSAECHINGNIAAMVGALLNLLVNALENGADKVRVRISMLSARRLQIAVIDDGQGIAAESQEAIFDPFYTTRSDGTGLGLAVVRLVVLAHEGNIQLSSDAGKGATFFIELPLADSSCQSCSVTNASGASLVACEVSRS